MKIEFENGDGRIALDFKHVIWCVLVATIAFCGSPDVIDATMELLSNGAPKTH